jgi:hypothetical protein
MTFLEFAFHELLGPPRGERSWHCPACDPNREMEWVCCSVLPPLGSYPIKWKCHNCGAWGDEHDLLRLLFPGEHNSDYRRLRLAELKEIYLREYPPRSSTLGDIAGEPKTLGQVLREQASNIAQRGNSRKRPPRAGKLSAPDESEIGMHWSTKPRPKKGPRIPRDKRGY